MTLSRLADTRLERPKSLYRPNRGGPNLNPPRGRVHVAPEVRRIGRLDTQQHKRGRIGLPNEPRASSDVGLLLDRAGELDAGAQCHLFQVGAKAGMALLVAGLAVMAVVEHTIDRFVGFITAIVASAPTFINNSPSPVTTTTRRSGRARARPRPIMRAPPIAPVTRKAGRRYW